MRTLTKIALAASALVATAIPARAADIPQPIPPVVMGGWYLRGDIGYSNQEVDSLFNVLYDTALDVDTVHADFDAGVTFGGGIGYRFNNWFRADLTGEYRGKTDFSGYDLYTIAAGTFPNNYDAKKSEWLVMANGYVDLGSWHGISPFVGAGIGAVNIEISDFTDNGFGPTGTSSAFADDNDEWNLAWAVHAGIGFDVTDALTLELAYRYLDLGDAASGDIIASDGTNLVDNPMEFEDITSHDVKLGVRYTFW